MRVILDTNALVSATFSNGASSKIINLIGEKRIIGITSIEILWEYLYN